MNKEIEVKLQEVGQDAIEYRSDKIEFTKYGVEIHQQPTIEEWHRAVKAVIKAEGMIPFFLGDLIAFAESPVTGWGHTKYEDLLKDTEYSYQTLKHFTSVSRRFPPEFRKSILEQVQVTAPISFSHFQEVKSLGDETARHFLTMVAEQRWTTAKLRDEVAKYKAKQAGEKVVDEYPMGRISFKEMSKQAFKGFVPQQDADQGYDEVTWLLEVKDWVEARLRELKVIE